MRVYSESNTKCHVVKIHQCWKLGLYDIIIEWKSIQYFACGSEIPLSRTSKLRTCVNHGFDETLPQNPLITTIVRKITVLAIQTGSFSFPTRNQGILSSSLIIIILWGKN